MEQLTLSFSPSVIYAGIDLTRLATERGESIDEVAHSLTHGAKSEITSNDIDGARKWMERFGSRIFSSAFNEQENFRVSLKNMIANQRPAWLRLAPSGRERFLNGLSIEIAQSFRIAALSRDMSNEVIAWWDEISSLARLSIDERKAELGRIAERRSFEREKLLLSDCDVVPIWVSVEDNGAGYDIKTWREDNSGGTKPHYIEVKSSSTSTRFFLSRGEWKFAEQNRDSWSLDFWLGDSPDALEFNYSHLVGLIPVDTFSSKWTNAEIDASLLMTQRSDNLENYAR